MSKDLKRALVTLLRELTRQIQTMDDDEIAELVSGTARIEVTFAGKKKLPTGKRSKATDEDVSHLLERLRAASSREEGERILNENEMSRGALARLARQLDIRLDKAQPIEDVRARIIESTIGYRLRSAAIQGVSPQ
jgi:hypothetical protein